MRKFSFFIVLVLSFFSSFAQKRHILQLSNGERKIGVYPSYEDLIYNDPLIKDSVRITKIIQVKLNVPDTSIYLNEITINDPKNYLKKSIGINFYYDGINYFYAEEKNPARFAKIIYLGRYSIYEYYYKYNAPLYNQVYVPINGGIVGVGLGVGISAVGNEIQKKANEKYDKLRAELYQEDDLVLKRIYININNGNTFEMTESNVESVIKSDKELHEVLNKLTDKQKFDQYLLSDFLIQYSEKHKDEIKLKKIH